MARQIRKAFIAPEGRVLLAADYSQIELRLMAHFSQDDALVHAFNMVKMYTVEQRQSVRYCN
ncbi:DNA polymerase [Acinetobacter baumannii]